MSRVASLLLAVLFASAVAEREVQNDVAQDTIALAVGADTHFKKMAQIRAHADEATAGGQLTIHQAKHMVLAHIKSFSSQPDNIAEFHLKAQEVILEMVLLFSAASPNVMEGIQKMGTGLFECVELLLPKEVKSASYFGKFRTAWMMLFKDLPSMDANIKKGIDAYAKDAKPEQLLDVVAICVKAAIEVVKSFMPEDVSFEIMKYMDGITEVMNGVVEGWSAFAEGKTVQGIEFVYDGMKDALDDVVPENLKNNDAYRAVMGTLDKQVRKLNDHVMLFKRRLEESKVCWRDDKKRTKTYPMTCGIPAWAGFYYAGHGACHKEKGAAGSLMETRALDHSLEGKWGDEETNEPTPAPIAGYHTRRALCSTTQEEVGTDRCADKCPDGYVKTEDGLRCLTKCSGNFSFPAATLWTVADGNMCGFSPQMIQMVKAEMAVAIVAATMKVVSVIQQMISDGKATADALSSIIDGVIAIAVPFNNPECGLEGDEEDEEE